MLERMAPVKNVLSIIAIFAGIAEVSGTAVLPFLTENNQAIFMRFVMAFPFTLLILFFLTLWLKHRVLYGPSDFRSDEGFNAFNLKQFEKPTNAAGDLVKQPLQEGSVIFTKL